MGVEVQGKGVTYIGMQMVVGKRRWDWPEGLLLWVSGKKAVVGGQGGWAFQVLRWHLGSVLVFPTSRLLVY